MGLTEYVTVNLSPCAETEQLPPITLIKWHTCHQLMISEEGCVQMGKVMLTFRLSQVTSTQESIDE